MPDTIETPSDLCLTPHGLLRVENAEPPSPWLDFEAGRRVFTAFTESSAHGLLHLGTRELSTPLPPGAAWWREMPRRYLTRLCHTPDLERSRELAPLPPPAESELADWANTAPPMRGGEYLNADRLADFWVQLDQHVRTEIASHPEGASAWLKERHPLWRMVGRVTFHLAENKRHPTHPFAFMASYASRLSNQSRVQHLPLGRALQEYAGAGNKTALLNLLAPVQKAAEQGAFVRELVESHRIFKPLPWTPAEAYRFLKEAPVCETAGVIVRLPDWWKGGRPPRPRVSVRIGQQPSAGLGADTLLDFSVETTLDGQPLTEAEWQSLLQAASGLALVRGQWVEVDSDKLREALAHWKKVEKLSHSDGLTFFEGMRLISGFQPGASAGEAGMALAAEREWIGIQPGQWLEEVLAELRDPSRTSAGISLPGLRADLRPYQAVGVRWLEFLARLGLGGCLADDMGLGKTLQVLALLLLRKTAARQKADPSRTSDAIPSLLIVPASLLANWRAEIERFTPELSFLILHPSESENPSAALDSGTDRKVDLVITTYGMVSRLKTLRERPWQMAVLDEAQAIKNPETRQARAVKELQATARFALTGTPVENRVGDLWSIFDFLNPGLLGSASAFAKYIRARDASERPDYGPLRALTRPYLLRRLKTDKRIIADLPDKTEVRAWCSLTKTQAALYQKAVSDLAEALETADGIQRRGLVLAFIMRFKQICNHPSQWLGDGGYAPEASGKFARLRELAEEIADRQEKALVFTQFREITDPLSAFLTEVFRRPGLVLHGGTAVPQRRRLVELFQRDDGPPFFLLTVKAGGAGLNLTQAAHVIHFDRWWNPAVENQATDRAFRIGQKQNVLVHKFVCRGTIEERIDQVIEDKKALSAELLEGGGEKLLTEMSNAELLSFVALDLHRATEV
ncbi:MAG TPA: DEAD/DEAH box helicase [Candidatus Paceibacterota bacterium]|nr:DEAD/DEAH box helicase [Verrucomicrobiota bacterium]HRY49457.1 DEAD/DEAH box helicase [Candidatus Paceibacterota bacterium]